MTAIVGTVDTQVQLQFVATDIDGISLLTGKVDGDFAKLLLLDAAVSALPVTVAEVSGAAGRYVIAFTPDQAGLWYVEVTDEVDDIFNCYVQIQPIQPQSTATLVEEIWRIMGLDPDNPLCVSKTKQEAGNIVLTQTEVGKKVIVQRQP